MTDDIIKRLREAIAAGPTPGPWEVIWRTNSSVDIEAPTQFGYSAKRVAGMSIANSASNAAYIAAASPDNIAALLDRLDAAERENERLRAENEALAADARRYRFIRDTPWGPDLINVIQMQMNGKWDTAIDAAMAAEPSERREG